MSNPDFRPGSDDEWAGLLRQLRLQAKAQPQPFFYARVHARLAAERRPTIAWLPAWVRRPAYAALLGALVLAMSGDGPALRPASPASQYGGYHPGQPAPH
ncbi:hypothetical protein GO988_19115 [Hymenobacter sp. HMF4947]|uniref:Uncharacterized protein n=1 Tax=Hymenobacter ginkgonis TaxID=2682976 RepID=A0A7K1TJ52_9BACT|nr:hypothetical protein [Hymenobacter ginkgonis]MVN78447.1 hypothetical protein [Hymenobacter ginkgonis]